MTRRITYYFTLLSPWAYIGHDAFMALAGRHGATVDFRPVSLAKVFSETGGLPLPKRHPARQRYRMLELQRWRDLRSLEFNLRPRFWPFEVDRADMMVVAAVSLGQDPSGFMRAVYAAVWEQDLDLGNAQTLWGIASRTLDEASRVADASRTQAIAERYDANTHAAIAADAFGSPVYVLDGEVFWGQDRLDILDHALKSGRRPFLATP